MLHPCRPVEGARPDRFRPSHCPWRECVAHRAERGLLLDLLPEAPPAARIGRHALLFQLSPKGFELVSDDHPAYRAALRRHPRNHKLWRHSQAHHRRETIAFGRRSNALLERGALMCVWRNFVKGVSERKPDPTSPAMRLGLTDRPWRWRDIFARRLFPERLRLPSGWQRVYRREWITPAVGRNVRHILAHAF